MEPTTTSTLIGAGAALSGVALTGVVALAADVIRGRREDRNRFSHARREAYAAFVSLQWGIWSDLRRLHMWRQEFKQEDQELASKITRDQGTLVGTVGRLRLDSPLRVVNAAIRLVDVLSALSEVVDDPKRAAQWDDMDDKHSRAESDFLEAARADLRSPSH